MIIIIKKITSFIKDEEYRIEVKQNSVYIYYYKNIIDIKSNKVSILIDKVIDIIGSDLTLVCLSSNELLIKGIIKEIRL